MFNILAETKSGDEKQTVVVGAHFDSVPAGQLKKILRNFPKISPVPIQRATRRARETFHTKTRKPT